MPHVNYDIGNGKYFQFLYHNQNLVEWSSESTAVEIARQDVIYNYTIILEHACGPNSKLLYIYNSCYV